VAIQLDCDLQDPTDMIVEFLNRWREGYDAATLPRQSDLRSRSCAVATSCIFRFSVMIAVTS
jgi:hypothetical protein